MSPTRRRPSSVSAGLHLRKAQGIFHSFRRSVYSVQARPIPFQRTRQRQGTRYLVFEDMEVWGLARWFWNNLGEKKRYVHELLTCAINDEGDNWELCQPVILKYLKFNVRNAGVSAWAHCYEAWLVQNNWVSHQKQLKRQAWEKTLRIGDLLLLSMASHISPLSPIETCDIMLSHFSLIIMVSAYHQNGSGVIFSTKQCVVINWVYFLFFYIHTKQLIIGLAH